MLRSRENPQGALRVLDDLSFAMDPAAVEQAMASAPDRVRFFNGYAGWSPGQLAVEIDRGGWYVLNANVDTVFRKDTGTLWEELLQRSRAITAFLR